MQRALWLALQAGVCLSVITFSGCVTSVTYPEPRSDELLIAPKDWASFTGSGFTAARLQTLEILSPSIIVALGDVFRGQNTVLALLRTQDGGRSWKYVALERDRPDLPGGRYIDPLLTSKGDHSQLYLIGTPFKAVSWSTDGESWHRMPTPISAASGVATSYTALAVDEGGYLGYVETNDCCVPPNGSNSSPPRMVFSVAMTSSNGSDWLSTPLPDECTNFIGYQAPLHSGDADTLFVECKTVPLWHLLRISMSTGRIDELDSFPSPAWPLVAIGEGEVLAFNEVDYTDADTGEPMKRDSLWKYDNQGKHSVIFSKETAWIAPGLKNLFLANNGISYFTFNHDVYESTDEGRSWSAAFRMPLSLYSPLRLIAARTAALISGEGIVLTKDGGQTLCDIGPFSTASCRGATE